MNASTTTAVEFKRENVKLVWPEILPLFQQHWEEIARFKDIPLEPDYEFYLKADEIGMLRAFTAREGGELLGYCVYFVRSNPHYKSLKQAQQDVLFIRKDKRGRFGMKFIEWCDRQLEAEGVGLVTQHVKNDHNFGKMLERIDYELVDLIYCRRLKG